MLGRFLAMVDYTDAAGDCLFDSLEYELQMWADGDPDGPPGGAPYAYDGDDGAGYGASREQFDLHLETPVRNLVLLLEADGRIMAAEMLRKAFDALAAQASLMDEWCEGRPSPGDFDGEIWPPPAAVFAAIGDPGIRVLGTCYDTIRQIREIVGDKGKANPAAGRKPSGKKIGKKIKPTGKTVDAVRALQAGKDTDYLVLEMGYSDAAARKLKSRWLNGDFEL